jgi:predicted membrane chloride channel (bestrophin family)
MAFLGEHDYNLFRFTQVEDSVLNNSAAWNGFSFLVGFLIVFRTSIAYSRFWEGCYSTHMMRAEWFDACSSIIAFCKHSVASKMQINTFQQLVVRLFTMLHAVALAAIEDVGTDASIEEIQAFKYELFDISVIDVDSLEALRVADNKVELVFQWIQQLIVENIGTQVLSIPSPILSRSFQELAQGMVHFHDACKLSTIPFPFPYAQTCDALLILHWILTPFVVSVWASGPYWAGIFSFASVFMLWNLNCIAVEIENPFGRDANDIDALSMQRELNDHLSLLLSPTTMRTPHLIDEHGDEHVEHGALRHTVSKRSSFHEVWSAMSKANSDSPSKPSRTGNSGVTLFSSEISEERNGVGGTDAQHVHSSSKVSQNASEVCRGPSFTGLASLGECEDRGEDPTASRTSIRSDCEEDWYCHTGADSVSNRSNRQYSRSTSSMGVPMMTIPEPTPKVERDSWAGKGRPPVQLQLAPHREEPECRSRALDKDVVYIQEKTTGLQLDIEASSCKVAEEAVHDCKTDKSDITRSRAAMQRHGSSGAIDSGWSPTACSYVPPRG